MKTVYIYKWTKCEDYNIPGNNYGEETESIVCEDPYDFSDWLSDNGITYDYDLNSDTYYVTDEDGNRTSEAYWIVDVVTDKMYEIYEMLRTYKDSTLIYSHTKKGRREYQHIETLIELIEAKALDIEEAEEAEADEMSVKQKYNEHEALDSAWHALCREFEIKAQKYVEEVVESAEFKRYIAANGYAY